MSNQQATVNEQPSSQINRSKQVPFGLLLPILIPQLAKDRAMQLTTLFNKLKKDEIPKDHFVRLMKGIVGDQMLRIALTKVQQQTKANAGSSGQQHPVRMPTVTSSGTKFNDPHALAQLHQRSMNPAADHSHNTSSAIQVKSEPTYSTMEIGAKKSLEHDVRVVQPNQLPSSGSNAVSQETERSSVHIQGLNKQQQQHIHFPSTYGSRGGNYNHFSGTATGSSSLRPQPHPHDSHIRQIPHQNIGLNHLGVERQSYFTDPKRMPGGSVSTGVNNTAPQQTSTSWQPSAEQNSGLFSSVSYVKKEPNDLSIEQQHDKSINLAEDGRESYNLDIEIDQGTVGTSQQAESGLPDAFDISLSHFALVLALENESGGIQEIVLEVDIRLTFNLRTTGMKLTVELSRLLILSQVIHERVEKEMIIPHFSSVTSKGLASHLASADPFSGFPNFSELNSDIDASSSRDPTPIQLSRQNQILQNLRASISLEKPDNDSLHFFGYWFGVGRLSGFDMTLSVYEIQMISSMASSFSGTSSHNTTEA
ncbi:unnamed protein product [Vicia faba]|uniref:RST domain-containing protein n=1 Tax=Vicia faba TaxID=3906 RepID=A0AAV0YCS9_VICFA|nr:unnamed protein product [Vicia faba]